MNKYYKNFILCGDIDFHCLVCNESFHQMAEVNKHLLWENHRKIAKEQKYLMKYKKEYIYKIDNRFYCEVCNITVESNEQLCKHVDNDKHIANKKNPDSFKKNPIAKRAQGLIYLDKDILRDEQWECIISKKCLLCNEVVKDLYFGHVDSESHKINLIQAENVEEDGKLYRKMDGNSVYCFICQEVLPFESINDHWSGHTKYSNCFRDFKVDSGNTESKEEVTNKLLESQKEFYNIDFENNMVTCKQCKQTFVLNYNSLLYHKERHDKLSLENDIIFDHGKKRAQLKEFGKQHFIKLNRGGNKGYCTMCNVFFSPHIINFKDHIKGSRHVGFLDVKGLSSSPLSWVKPKYESVPFSSFLTHLFHSGSMKVFWVNKTYCVDTLSFVYMCPIPNKPFYEKCICYVCDVVYLIDEKHEHCKLDAHKDKVLSSKFISSLQGEFVREIQPDIYHCGYCNQIFPYWVNLEKHLHSHKHYITKKSKEFLSHLTHRMFKDGTTEELDAMNLLSEVEGLGLV